MDFLRRILGPKSKYDITLPYTYEARVRLFLEGEEYNSYFSDTICGLVEYLQQKCIQPDAVKVFEVYRNRECLIDTQLFTTSDHQWLCKPDICRTFEQHYKGHIQNNKCSFMDRDRGGIGP